MVKFCLLKVFVILSKISIALLRLQIFEIYINNEISHTNHYDYCTANNNLST